MRPIPRSLLFALALLVVAVLSLGSLAYPLVTTPIPRTDTLTNTITSNYASWSTVSSVVAGWVPYATSTGQAIVYNYLCDPASMACAPTQTFYTTQTLSNYEANTQISQVTFTTQSVRTQEFEVTHTDYGMIPAYAAFGISDSQFVVLAGIVILILALAVLGMFVKTRGATTSHQVKRRRGNLCQNCGSKLPSGSRFCTECGSKQS
jgi:hypothetical protein